MPFASFWCETCSRCFRTGEVREITDIAYHPYTGEDVFLVSYHCPVCGKELENTHTFIQHALDQISINSGLPNGQLPLTGSQITAFTKVYIAYRENDMSREAREEFEQALREPQKLSGFLTRWKYI